MTRNAKPYDPWSRSDIQEVFDLPVNGAWLITWMKDTGIKTEAKGGIRFKSGFTCYRLKAIPEVAYSTDSLSLTWLYTWNSIHYPTEKPTLPWMLWKVRELTESLSIQVHAYCSSEEFSQQFYQLIELVKKSARKYTKMVEPEENLLTNRETEIADLLAKGMNDEAIANELIISPATVKKHRQHIADKLNIGEGVGEMQRYLRQRGYGEGTKKYP